MDEKTVYKIEKPELDKLLFKIWLLDCKSANGNQFFGTIPLTRTEKHTLEFMYKQVLFTLEEAYRCLREGGEVRLIDRACITGEEKVEQVMLTTQQLLEWVRSFDNLGMNTTKSQEIIVQKLMAL